MSMRRQVLSFLFFSTMSGLLAAMVLSLWIGMSHSKVMLSFLVTALGSCSYHRSFTLMPNSLQIFQCMCATALLWRWVYLVLASSGHPETSRWSMILSNGHTICILGPRRASLRCCIGTACQEALILGYYYYHYHYYYHFALLYFLPEPKDSQSWPRREAELIAGKREYSMVVGCYMTDFFMMNFE